MGHCPSGLPQCEAPVGHGPSGLSLPWCGSVPQGCPCCDVGCPWVMVPQEDLLLQGEASPKSVSPAMSPPVSLSTCLFPCTSHFPFCVSFSLQLLLALTHMSRGTGSPGCSVSVRLFPRASDLCRATHGLLPRRAPCSPPLPKPATLHPIQMYVVLLCCVKKIHKPYCSV